MLKGEGQEMKSLRMFVAVVITAAVGSSVLLLGMKQLPMVAADQWTTTSYDTNKDGVPDVDVRVLDGIPPKWVHVDLDRDGAQDEGEPSYGGENFKGFGATQATDGTLVIWFYRDLNNDGDYLDPREKITHEVKDKNGDGDCADPGENVKTVQDGLGGIAELPDIAGTSAEEAVAPAEGSGWSAGAYAGLAGGLAAAVLVLGVGGWYVRRRWIR